MKRFYAFIMIFVLACCGNYAYSASKGAQFDFLLSQVRNIAGSAAGGTVTFYEAGTTTKKTVWLDRNKTIVAANPYTLDANGTAQIYGDGLYRVVIKSVSGTTLYDRDNINVLDYLTSGAYQAIDADYSSLNHAIRRIGSTPTTLTIRTQDFPVTASVAVPSTLALDFKEPGSLAVGAYTITGLKEARPEWFGAVGDDSTDNSTAFATLAAMVQASSNGMTIVFPAGIYRYSTSPNWAKDNTRIIADGIVRFRYTGTGNAVIIDAGATASDNVYNMEFGPFHIDCPSTAQDAVYRRGIHHSTFKLNIHGAGTNYAGFRSVYGVLNNDYLTISGNEEGGWYLSSKPKYGIYFDERNTGEPVSYDNLWRPIIEGPDFGIYLDHSLGTTVFGGTAEGCHDTGLVVTANCSGDKFYGLDTEGNTTHDMDISGNQGLYSGCDSDTNIVLSTGAAANNFIGGSYNNITLDAGTASNIFTALMYNRLGTGAISDSGALNRFTSVVDNTGAFYIQTPSYTQVLVPTVTASPYTYTNNTAQFQIAYILGGTVTGLKHTHGGIQYVLAAGTNTIALFPGDLLEITYSSAPTLNINQ